MATYYAAADGTSGAAGTSKGAPWNMDRATQSVGGTPAAGDTVRIKAGTYTGVVQFRVSGVTYLANWDGETPDDVIFTGARLGMTQETGWSLVTGSSLGNGVLDSSNSGLYADGGNSGTATAAKCVWRKTISSFAVRGAFCHDYVHAAGTTFWSPGSANWWWVAMVDCTNNEGYGWNPNLRMHDYDPSHDDYVWGGRTEHKHDWRGQWRQEGATVCIRTYNSADPNTGHAVYLTGIQYGLEALSQSNIVLDGGAGRHLHVYHYKQGVHFNGCNGMTVRRAVVKWCNAEGITVEGCGTVLVDDCLIQCGCAVQHNTGGCIGVSSSNGFELKGSTLNYGGHQLLLVKASSNVHVHDNEFAWGAGHGIWVKDGTCANLLIERNSFRDIGYVDCVVLHKEPHPAIFLGDTKDSRVRRNIISRCGRGFDRGGVNSGWSNIQIYDNTVTDFECNAIRAQEWNGATPPWVQNCRIQNNILMGPHHWPNSSEGYTIRYQGYQLAAQDGWGNEWRNNDIYCSNAPGGKPIFLVDMSGSNYQLTATEANGSGVSFIKNHWSGNIAADPVFTSLSGDDLTLQAGSPCINAGSATGLNRTGDDPISGNPDIGRYEYGGSTTKPTAIITETAARSTDANTGAVTIDLDGSTSTAGTGSITAYDWDWDDGSAHGTTANPGSKTYTQGRTYTVRLVVTNTPGVLSDAALYPFTVTEVHKVPVAKITVASGGNGGAAPWTVDVNDASTIGTGSDTIAAWHWDFGDGTTSTVQNPPNHVYSAAGTYTITLYCTSSAGVRSASPDPQVTIVVTSGAGEHDPVARIALLSGTPGDAPCTLTFDGTGSGSVDAGITIASYAWDFGDTGTSTASQPSHEYTNPGNYVVTLTVTDTHGTPRTSLPVTSGPYVITSPASDPRIAYDPALVIATSAQPGFTAGKVGDRSILSGHLDGGVADPEGFWNFDAPGGAVFPQAVRIELPGGAGSYHQLSRVRWSPTKWDAGRTYQYEILYSTEELACTSPGWVSLGAVATSAATEWTDTGNVAPVSARFVLLRLLSNNETATAKRDVGGAWEVECCGKQPNDGTAGRPYLVSAFADEDGNAGRWGPQKSRDGKLARDSDPYGSWWIALLDVGGAPKSKWLRHDLGSARQVGRVRISFAMPERRRYSYALEGSTTGTSWTNLLADGAAAHTSGTGEWTEERFPVASARYIRLTVLSCEGGATQVCRVWEMECYAV